MNMPSYGDNCVSMTQVLVCVGKVATDDSSSDNSFHIGPCHGHLVPITSVFLE